MIATGGGAILLAENRQHLASRGCVVYLKTGVAHQLERTRHGRHRPLLNTQDPQARLCSLMEQRAPLYESLATIVVHTDGRQVRAVADDIVQGLSELNGP